MHRTLTHYSRPDHWPSPLGQHGLEVLAYAAIIDWSGPRGKPNTWLLACCITFLSFVVFFAAVLAAVMAGTKDARTGIRCRPISNRREILSKSRRGRQSLCRNVYVCFIVCMCMCV
jgi:hypothetical protein